MAPFPLVHYPGREKKQEKEKGKPPRCLAPQHVYDYKKITLEIVSQLGETYYP